MARIVLDPDDVNQDRVVTLTDGTRINLSDADAGLLARVARQLHIHRSSYLHALSDEHGGDRVAAGEVRLEDVAPLYLRVTALLERAREGRRRTPTELDLDLLFQGRIWTSSSGTTKRLDELTPTHRRNLLRWLERQSDDLRARVAAEQPPGAGEWRTAEPWVAGTPLYRRLQQLVERETGRDHAMDQARQIARAIEFERSGDWPEE